MRLKYALSISLSLIVVSQQALALNDSTITYQNQRGSILGLTFHHDKEDSETGTLTGTFTTAVARCKELIGVPQPITGYFNGNAVSISVNFPGCKSAVAMTGHILNNQNDLITLWLVVDQVADPIGKDWTSNITGTDSYHRIDN